MTMIKSLMLVAACALAAAPAVWAEQEDNDSTDNFKFKDLKTIKTTSVKDQNKSGTCWCFCTTSFIEDEIMRIGGDSLDLSEMYTVRNCYLDKADHYVRMYGHAAFGPGGSALDVPYSIKRYGIMPESAYPGIKYGEEKHVHGELDGLLTAYVNTIVKKPNSKISPVWKEGYEAILDTYLGKVPETFEYNGKTYTPQTFAQSLGLNMDDYVAITSFTHHPFYEEFILEMPDNWINGLYYNVPLDELKAVVDNAIEKGFPVSWAADVSERGFKWYDGVALLPKIKDGKNLEGSELSRWVKLSDKDRADETYNFKAPVPEMEVTQELRQQMFDSQETTDDHGMEIIGIAEDCQGNRYYKVKNSWDDNQVYGGYIYVSEPYFLAKTMNVLVHRDALPKDLAKRMKK